MPQETNLNVSPYFDDFDPDKNFYRVLFKPGYPIQARELTSTQSILQNQIEQFGNHIFKEGSVVIPGQVNYNNQFYAVKVESEYAGIPVNFYLNDLVGKTIKGSISKIRAKIIHVIDEDDYGNEYVTLYVNYLGSGISGESVFLDGESLNLEETLVKDSVLIQSGEGFSTTISNDSTSVGSAVILSEGVYFIRGTFVSVYDQILILEPYSNIPSYQVGFTIDEQIVTSDEDSSLNDNAQGFSNYAAPGADRLKITAILSKKELNNFNNENFISLLDIRDGQLISTKVKSQYSVLQDELSRRTSEESGDYYVKPFAVSSKESLNDSLGNGGIFSSGQLTYNGNTPSDSLGVYKISPGKAYVKGREVDIPSTVFLDYSKPRTTKTLENQRINYFTGSTYTLNRVYGAPNISLETPFIVSLRDSRVGTSQSTAPGKEIGLARVYDFALESGSYNTSNLDINQWDISLYDIQTYIEIELNEPVTLSTPVHIKGKFSGASAYLRYDVTNSGIITAYNIEGKFSSGEKFIFNGVESTSRIAKSVIEYNNKDVKSISNISTSSTLFTGDIVPSEDIFVGFADVSQSSVGVSTLSISDSSNVIFSGLVKLGSIIKYTKPGDSLPTYSTIQSISPKQLQIVGLTTVSGINEGSLPLSDISVNDFAILASNFQQSSDNSLYTVLPKSNISSVNLDSSSITIKKEFAVTITSNQSNTITAGDNETFLPFDEERYVLIRSDGSFEVLSQDKFIFTNGSKELTIFGLGSNDSSSRLIATLTKTTVKSKIKNRNKVKSIIVSKSRNPQSGIGSTTINDGLEYGIYPYGTRVQDEEICLLVPDVNKIHAVIESSGNTNPILPSLLFNSINSPLNITTDMIVGEKFTGNVSGSVCLYVQRKNDLSIEYVNLNDKKIQSGEVVTFEESGITATVSSVLLGDSNITSSFTFDYGQKTTIYDYSKLVRNNQAKELTRKIKIIFESSEYSTSDDGDITTVNSYNQFNYCDIQSVNNDVRNSDIIDIRPKVTPYTVVSGSARSPFEFLSRSFDQTSNSAKNILASDESILINYSYYLPRIDKIFLSKDGIFQLNQGEPSDNPQPPAPINDALEVASIYLPAYLCDTSKVSISLLSHKRYQMKDIKRLEDRIRDIEYFTNLNLLEISTESLTIKDFNGLDRFKSGFFVDNFTTTLLQNKNNGVKNSIDIKNGYLRPSPFTTELDLIVGSRSNIGIGTSANPNVDTRFATDLIGNNIKRTGQLVTIDYEDVVKVQQPYATRVENVTPYLVTRYTGTIELFPSSDTWVDQVRTDAKKVEIDNYTETEQQLIAQGFDPQTGYGPITWDSWETTWTGESVDVRTVRGGNRITTTTTTTTTGTSTREGSRLQLSEEIDTYSQGDSIISADFISYMRSRNVEFTGKRFKPFTQVYGFFDGENVNNYIIPKLLEVSMTSGTFEVGETVIGILQNSSIDENQISGQIPIQFVCRLAKANHRYGPYNDPSDIFISNPYNSELTTTLPEDYSSTTEILNIDTTSLSEQVQGNFYGYVQQGMILKGQSSGAQASVTNVRLFTDDVGTIIGSFYIPNPNVPSNPTFETGTKTFRLTSSSINSQIEGIVTTSAEENYYALGLVNTVQETMVSVRNPKIKTDNLTESREVSDVSISVNTRVIPSPPDPLGQSFLVSEPNGIYITKVDLFFRTKDQQLPVVVQLRPMSNGIPKTEVYPFSEVIVNPSEVNVSEDGSIATTIIFPSPIYLRGNTENALVLLSESNDYTVWISRLGEVDITTQNQPESQKIVVTQQPFLGSLFKSQNGSTWSPSQYEDLKFTLYKARFTNSLADFNLYNPNLSFGNKQVANLTANPLDLNSKKIRVSLSSSVTDSNFILGNTVVQQGSTGRGNYIGIAGSAVGNLTVINSGIGYSDGYYPNVPLINETGFGINASANITISAGSIVSLGATISSGGSGYQVGDIVTVSNIGGSSLGRNIKLSISQLNGNNEIIIDNVQGDFQVGAGKTIQYESSVVGVGTTDLNGTSSNITIDSITNYSEESDGLHILVNHKNHGMHSGLNIVSLSNVYSDLKPSFLSTEYTSSSSGDITLTEMYIDSETSLSIFEYFENIQVSPNNPGYILVDNEIISYEGVNGNNLTGVTRSIDQTKSFTYSQGTAVFKYELNGISLRRINKTHFLSDSNISRPIDLDYYYLKLDMSSGDKGSISENGPNGLVDRSTEVLYPKLYINETKSSGGVNILASQNIQFEIVKPIVQNIKLPNTNLSAKIRTIGGTSIDGIETPYVDQGFEPINLDSNNYLSSPRLIASEINESNYVSLPGRKSFTLNLQFNTSDENISPAVDLDRVGMIFTSNRVNKPIDNYSIDPRVSSLSNDPSAFVYASNPISLTIPASSIKIYVGAHLNEFSDIRAFYSVLKDPNETPIYYPFPGYNNIINIGQPIDISDSNGLPDFKIQNTDTFGENEEFIEFKEYEFTIDDLPEFRHFSIKLIGTSTNQAYPPKFKSLRVISLA
jgi:hypothetical protein